MARNHRFVSKAQWRYCYATQARHPTWNCHKWGEKAETGRATPYRALPYRVRAPRLRSLR